MNSHMLSCAVSVITQNMILQVLRSIVLQARDLSPQVYILNLLLSELMLKLLDTSL